MQKFCLALGAALTVTCANDTNFRKKSFCYPFRWKRIKKPLITFFAAAAALFFSLGALELRWIQQKQQSVQQAYDSFLTVHGAGLSAPEPLSTDEIILKIEDLERDILSRPETFPLLPGVPKVRDFLAWLSMQTSLKKEKGISLDNIHYTMVKRPDLSNKKEKYLVRVDLSFHTDNPSSARSFHDTLLEPNGYIDLNREVQWHADQGKYRASFFLKDKTRYS